jgi:hypothetical protein
MKALKINDIINSKSFAVLIIQRKIVSGFMIQ